MALDHLPGGRMVAAGLRDIEAERDSVESFVVWIAATRLRDLGLPVPVAPDVGEPELRLYRALRQRDPEVAYVRYNALLDEVVSFASALERETFAGLQSTDLSAGDVDGDGAGRPTG